MKHFFRLTLVLLFVLASNLSYSQDTISVKKIPTKKYAKYLDFRFENGAMLSNDSEIGDQLVNSSYYNGIDFRLGFRKTNPDDVYSNVYRRPYLGVGLYLSTFHNEDIGKPHAIYFFMKHPFAFEQNKKLTFSYSGAFGISYRFNPFDSIQNPANIFIGSYRNCYVHLGFEANYKFSDKWAINGTVGFKHFSNGSFKQPNYGINVIPLTLGVSYKFGDDEIELFPKPIPEFKKYNLFNVMMAFGSKNYINNDPNYLKMTLGLNYLRAVSHRYRIGIGMDFFYSSEANLRNNSNASDFSKSISYAVVPNWEWVISKRIYVPLGIGIYLHRNTENDERYGFYERAGIMCRISEHMSTGLTIKAHKGVADYFEWTLGYTFHKDPNKY